MNAEQRYELLIEYAEGTLPAEQRKTVEALLVQYPGMQNDLETIHLAFDSLHVERQSAVPEQYFANFVSNVRSTIVSGKERSGWLLPDFLLTFIKPAAAFSVVAGFVLLFRVFEPSSTQTAIYSLVNDLEQGEIVSVIEETTTAPLAAAENILETKLPRESFGIDPSNYQNESEMFALLEDHEAEQVVELLQQKER